MTKSEDHVFFVCVRRIPQVLPYSWTWTKVIESENADMFKQECFYVLHDI